MKEVVNYTDIWYQVVYECEVIDEFYSTLNFTAYKIETMTTAVNGKKYPTEIENNFTAKGYIKFDGCMEVELSNCHFCGNYQAQQFGDLFQELYKKAKSLGLNY